jgi:hypothetical protein
MNDEQLTKELEDVLAIEPTPQFLARMRREIGTERTWFFSRAAFTLIAAGTTAAALIIGILMFQPVKRTPFELATVPKAERPLPLPVLVTPAAPSVSEVPKLAVKQLTGRPAKAEVLIDPHEMAALQSFLYDVRERNIAPARLEALFESAKTAERVTIEPMPIAAIEPIVIMPLSSPGSETGGDL